MFEPLDDDRDSSDFGFPGEPDAESAESMDLWCGGLLENPIDERDYRAADEAQFYGELASIVRRFGSAEGQECANGDLEDLNER